MRLLWLLPKAAPALLRHLVAYVDLVSVDLARAQREFMAELVISAITAICTLFAALMGCLALVAYTWDTPYRMTAIAWMGGGFLVAAVVAALYRMRVLRAKSEFLGSVRRVARGIAGRIRAAAQSSQWRRRRSSGFSAQPHASNAHERPRTRNFGRPRSRSHSREARIGTADASIVAGQRNWPDAAGTGHNCTAWKALSRSNDPISRA